MKSLSGKQDEKKDKKKVKFTTPLNSYPVNKDKQVNIVQTTEEGHHGESENLFGLLMDILLTSRNSLGVDGLQGLRR